jgi:uncharacterized protein
MSEGKGRSAPCPRCGQPASLAQSNVWRPFCTERCKMIDLGKWASGAYAIPAEEQPQESAGTDDSVDERKH